MMVSLSVFLTLIGANLFFIPAAYSFDNISDTTHECRLWAAISDGAPANMIINHLLTLPNSLKYLAQFNNDGWAAGYYFPCHDIPIIYRGQMPAYTDPAYDSAVMQISTMEPRVAVAHIRRCSSGPCDISNPHPFVRIKNGKHWLMAHNGTNVKQVVLGLIRPDYLASNMPKYGGSDTNLWIGSELYFIYILQTLEDFSWEVKPALGHVIQSLHDQIPEISRYLNFYLTDGLTLWTYREGHTLFYRYDTTNVVHSEVASQYPSVTQEDWIEIEDAQIVTLTCDNTPLVEEIDIYFDRQSVIMGNSITNK